MNKTIYQIEIQTLKDLVTSSLHLLVKAGLLTDHEIEECDSFKEMTSLCDTKTLLIIQEERNHHSI